MKKLLIILSVILLLFTIMICLLTASTVFTVGSVNANAESTDQNILQKPVKIEIEEPELESAPIETYAIFAPDRCVLIDFVKETSSTWEILTPSKYLYILPKKAKHGWKNPATGKEVEIMPDIKGNVVGWKSNLTNI